MGDHTRPWQRLVVGALRGLLWFVTCLVITGLSLRNLHTRTPGDSGDGLFILSVLDWGADRLPHLMAGYWEGPFFAPAHDPMAYSDTLLGAVPPYWLLRLVTGSSIVALNVLLLACWVATSEFTFRLARRITANPPAAVIAAIGFTYSTILLTQINHPQLTIGAPLVPLSVHLALRVLDRPTLARGAALGASVGVLTATTTYYGIFVVITVTVVVLVRLIGERRVPDARMLAAGGIAAAVMVVLAGPVVLHYVQIGRDPHFQRPYTPEWALMPGDLRTANPRGYLYGRDSLLANRTAGRTPERYAFPGLVMLVGAVTGATSVAVTAIARRRRGGDASRQRWPGLNRPLDLLAIGGAGVVAVLIALGRYRVAGVELPFRNWAAGAIPGFSGIRALVRFVIVFQLAFAMLAAVGVASALTAIQRPLLRSFATALLAILLVVECRALSPTVKVPVRVDGGVYAALADLRAGVVVELPMAEPVDINWPFTEVPRMVAGRDGRHPRVNGYSGYAPVGYEDWVRASRRLGDEAALSEVLDLGVRYIVLHTTAVDPGMAGLAGQITRSGDGAMASTDAEALIASLPDSCVRRVVHARDGAVVELDPEACRDAPPRP